MTAAAERVLRAQQQRAELELQERKRNERAAARFLELSGSRATRKALQSVEVDEQRELGQLITEQHRDDTHVVERPHGEISLDAPDPDGEGTIGADLVGMGEDGEIVSYLPPQSRERGGTAPVTHDGPGRPRSKPLSPLALWSLEHRIVADTAALQADDPSMSLKRARSVAIGQFDPRPTLDALKQVTGEPQSNLTRWRLENGQKIPRGIEADIRKAASLAAGKYPGGFEGIRHEVREHIFAGQAVVWPFPRVVTRPADNSRSHEDEKHDPDAIPEYDHAPAQA